MSKANEPAFPVTTPEGGYIHSYGMSLRTYLAGQAMMGLLADHTVNAEPSKLAQSAVMCADALIAELDKTEK